jgi:glucose-6-phosphate isomerase
MEVEPGVTSGDYLSGFLLGTREALFEKGRESMTVTIEDVSARTLGALIALYERAVGLYASLVNINAYHQPGVEAGKRAAGDVIGLEANLLAALAAAGGREMSAEDAAEAAGAAERAEWAFKTLEHLAANPSRGVVRSGEAHPDSARYRKARPG